MLSHTKRQWLQISRLFTFMCLTRMADLPVVWYVFPPWTPTCPLWSPVFPPFGVTPCSTPVAFTPPFESLRALQPFQIFPFFRFFQSLTTKRLWPIKQELYKFLRLVPFVICSLLIGRLLSSDRTHAWSLICKLFSCRHSFSEDIWVKFSNLSEDKIIGTYDSTAHVSRCGALGVWSTCLLMAQSLKFVDSLELYGLRKWSRN